MIIILYNDVLTPHVVLNGGIAGAYKPHLKLPNLKTVYNGLYSVKIHVSVISNN